MMPRATGVFRVSPVWRTESSVYCQFLKTAPPLHCQVAQKSWQTVHALCDRRACAWEVPRVTRAVCPRTALMRYRKLSSRLVLKHHIPAWMTLLFPGCQALGTSSPASREFSESE